LAWKALGGQRSLPESALTPRSHGLRSIRRSKRTSRSLGRAFCRPCVAPPGSGYRLGTALQSAFASFFILSVPPRVCRAFAQAGRGMPQRQGESPWALHYAVPGWRSPWCRTAAVMVEGLRGFAIAAPPARHQRRHRVSTGQRVPRPSPAATVAAFGGSQAAAWRQPMVELLPKRRAPGRLRRPVGERRAPAEPPTPAFRPLRRPLRRICGYEPAMGCAAIRYVERPAPAPWDVPAFPNIAFFLGRRTGGSGRRQPFTDLSRTLIFQPAWPMTR